MDNKADKKENAVNMDQMKIPCEIPLSERRRFIRHPLYFPLAYKIIKGRPEVVERSGKSMTINVSMAGLLFAARHSVKAGSTIIIKMPVQDKIFNVRSKVVYCTKNTETKLYNIGVSFYKFNDAFKVKLIEQIYLITEFRDLRSMQLGREISLEEASREWIKRYSERFRRIYW